MAKKKTLAISGNQLHSALAKAVKAISDRTVTFEPNLHIRPGIIIGRMIREQLSLDEAESVADRLTSEVSKAAKLVGGQQLSPAVLVIKRQITVGFIDPSHLPISLG